MYRKHESVDTMTEGALRFLPKIYATIEIAYSRFVAIGNNMYVKKIFIFLAYTI